MPVANRMYTFSILTSNGTVGTPLLMMKSVCDKKSSLPVSWNPPLVTKLSAMKNHHVQVSWNPPLVTKSLCDKKSSLPVSWNPPLVTKLSATKNHHVQVSWNPPLMMISVCHEKSSLPLTGSVKTNTLWLSIRLSENMNKPVWDECWRHEARGWEHPKMHPPKLYPGPTIQYRS